MTRLDRRAIIKPETTALRTLIELRGQSGRMYGLFDPQALTIEFRLKRDEAADLIDLRPYLEAAEPPKPGI